MPAGVQLSELIDQLNYETRQSSNVAHGTSTRDARRHILKRTQEELWLQHNWPHLRVAKRLVLAPGERRRNYPEGLTFEAVNDVAVLYAPRWVPLGYGITADDLELHDSDAGVRSSPVQKWQHAADVDLDNQFEVWPVPDRQQTLRFLGQRPLRRFIEDNDTSTLDGTLIVLYAAAEILAAAKAEDAPLKQQKAQAYFRALKSRQGAAKNDPFVIGGGGDAPRGRIGLDYIPIGYGSDGRGG